MATTSQQAHTTASPVVNSSRAAANGQSQPSEAVQTRRDLTSWWKGFKRSNAKPEEAKGKRFSRNKSTDSSAVAVAAANGHGGSQPFVRVAGTDQEPQAPAGIFGVPLHQSIRYANVAISLVDDDGHSYIYGYVPIVVAKCGVYLKEQATETEGIFRLAGSEKRIKELRVAFDSPDKYGKTLNWDGYNVHDAANVLRRYFNQLPEPIIPLTFYDRFRTPLKGHQLQAVGSSEKTDGPDDFNADNAIRSYQGLITELPPLNRQLLLYILDLLAVFASKSETNKMNTPNLAAIFQPGILSHPQHDMAPEEYRLSQDVLIFLIENQDHFLIGMNGTATDENTMKELTRPQPTTESPGLAVRSKNVLQRSSSNASGTSQKTRRFSGIRRNLSTSSRASNLQSSPHASPSMGGGVHRSNTVPSQRRASSPRFTRENSADPPTPSPRLSVPAEYPTLKEVPEPDAQGDETPTPLGVPPAILDVTSASSSEATTPVAAPGSDTSSAILIPKTRTETEDRPALLTPEAALRDPAQERASSRTFRDMFKQSSNTDSEPRTPRKLQKKRGPGGSISSAHSSAHDLHHEQGYVTDSVGSPVTPSALDFDGAHDGYMNASPSPALRAMSRDSTARRGTSDGLQPGSPYMSEQSRASVTDISDVEGLDEGAALDKAEKKKGWRFSRSLKAKQTDPSTPETVKGSGAMPIAAVFSAERGRVGSGSSNSQTHPESIQTPMTESTAATDFSTIPSNEADDKKKGPISWIRGKIHNGKEKDSAEKRAKSPAPPVGTGESLSSTQEGVEDITPTPTPSTAKMETVEEVSGEPDATKH